MANTKNWLPEMSLSEHEWFDKCPKAVLLPTTFTPTISAQLVAASLSGA